MKTPSLVILSVCHAATVIIAVTANKTTTYNAAELLSKIFNSNSTLEARQRGYGFVKFEDQNPEVDPEIQDSGQYGLIDNPEIGSEIQHSGQYGLIDNPEIGSEIQDSGQYGPIDFERDQRPLRFEEDYDNQNYINDNNAQDFNENRPIKFENEGQTPAFNGGVTFQDDNKVEDQGNKKRKRRRRRKPKKGVLPYPGVSGGRPQGRPGFQGVNGGRPQRRPGVEGPLQSGYGLNPYGNPGYPGSQPFRRPRRRPKPSLATEALSSITGALTSIARYDDYQCVPRLLCEAAGGGALGNGVLQSVAGIQPLLTILSAYNGLSTSPLFVFGRAVFLGMTSKGNTGTCRYAYPQCPTDPEQLIYYLNNHNGGFFRFFNAPQLPNQNVEQFYNQLSQGYDIYQNSQPQYDPNSGQYPNDPNSGQNYGFYDQNPNAPYDGQGHGQNNGQNVPGYSRPGLYNNQNYGSNYAYDYNYGSGNQIRFKENTARIEKRIQNKPTQNLADDTYDDDDVKTNWQFPHDSSSNTNNNDYNIRDIRTLKFPEENQSYNDQNNSERKGKETYFPQNQNHQNYYNDRQHIFPNNNRYETTTYSYNKGQNNQNYYNNNNNRPYTNNNNYKPPAKYHNHDYNPTNNNANYQNNQNYYNNRQNIYNNNYKYPTTTYNNEEYVFDHKHNFYVKKDANNHSNNNNNYHHSNYNNHNKQSYNSYNNQDHNKYGESNSNQDNYNNNYLHSNYNNHNDNKQSYNSYNNQDHNKYGESNSNQDSYNNYNNQDNYNNYNNHDNNKYRDKVYDYKRYEDNGLKTVYVVRGNGDPNKPEIVKLRPGQSVY